MRRIEIVADVVNAVVPMGHGLKIMTNPLLFAIRFLNHKYPSDW
jgi:hypothetical protein